MMPTGIGKRISFQSPYRSHVRGCCVIFPLFPGSMDSAVAFKLWHCIAVIPSVPRRYLHIVRLNISVTMYRASGGRSDTF